MRQCPQTSGKAGFSLVEISIVLAIVATMLAGVLPAITESMKSRDSDTTVSRMETIQSAIASYYAGNGQLPCPANIGESIDTANYGVEAANNTCTGGVPSANFASGMLVGGGVPTKTLGLGDEFGFDGWGRRFVYHVDARATVPATFNAAGGLRVNDASGSARTSNAMYVLVSHGANGHGGYSRAGTRFVSGSVNLDELNNCDCASNGALAAYDGVFVQKMAKPTDPNNPNTMFDDIVAYKNPMSFPRLGATENPARAMMGSYTEDHISGTSFSNSIHSQRGGHIDFPGGNLMSGGIYQRVRFTFDTPLPEANYYVGGNISGITKQPDYVEFYGCNWQRKCNAPKIEFFVIY